MNSDIKGGLPGLAHARVAAFYSQAQLAKASGVGVATIKRLESRRAASSLSAHRLAAALGVTVAQLRTPWEPPEPKPLVLDVGDGTMAGAIAAGRASVQPHYGPPQGATVSEGALEALQYFLADYLPVDEVAHELHVSARWIEQLIERGELPGVVKTKLGTLIPPQSVDAAKQRRAEKAKTDAARAAQRGRGQRRSGKTDKGGAGGQE